MSSKQSRILTTIKTRKKNMFSWTSTKTLKTPETENLQLRYQDFAYVESVSFYLFLSQKNTHIYICVIDPLYFAAGEYNFECCLLTCQCSPVLFV